MPRRLTAIILAAGKGVRMDSATPKVLHKLCGRELIAYSLDLCLALKIKEIIVVLGQGKDKVGSYLSENYAAANIRISVQNRPCGTADAVLSAKNKIAKSATDLLVLYADQPLLGKDTLRRLVNEHYNSGAAATFLTAELANPCGYGRVIRGIDGKISAICEDKNLSPGQSEIREVNAGSAVFKKEDLFYAIKQIKPDSVKKEYYLTEAVRILVCGGRSVSSLSSQDISEITGVNSRAELAALGQICYRKTADKFFNDGVTIVSPETTFINYGVKIGRDTVIKPFVYIDSGTVIGKNCVIGPFCHIRGGTKIKDNVAVGSFAELNRSFIDSHTKIKHFSYVSDAVLGRNVNIGAGTVTANFDGKNKHKTFIGEGAFIGSDTVLVAPVKIGKRAVTGAGCVVTKNRNVAPGEVVAGVPAKPIRRASQKKRALWIS